MDKKSKGVPKKSENKNKKAANTEPPAAGVNIVEAKFLAWKKNAKPSKNFPFLDAQLFADFLGFSSNHSSINTSTTKPNAIRIKSALKYLNTIKYIEQHSDSEELESTLHNIAFIYDIDKDALKKEVVSVKKVIKKAPNNIPLDQYLKQLDENDFRPPRIIIDEEDLDTTVPEKEIIEIEIDKEEILEIQKEKEKPAPKATKKGGRKKSVGTEGGVDLKEISDIKDLEVFKKGGKAASQKAGKKSKFEEALDRQADSNDSLKKKVKDNNSLVKEVIAETKDSDAEEQQEIEEKNFRSKKNKEKGAKKPKVQTNPRDMIVVKVEHDAKEKKPVKYVKNGKSLAEEVKQHSSGQFMELLINNEIDDDDGDGFNFFFVNENVYNKTKQYFEKKPRPEQICSCLDGCNDPTICPCARMNFENCGKTACYVFDTKSGKKRLLNNLIRKDMHIYECSSQCACHKSMCFNSCVTEGKANRPEITDFIIERYNKVYNGQDPSLKGMASIMWGLKARVLIPANTYVVEYCGEIITKKEGDRRGEKYDSVNCNYLFDLNKHAEIEKIDESNNTITLNIDGICETRNMNKLKDIAVNFPLVIDAFFYGNHSRFVNHSCNPNMVALAVHTENRNILLPRIIFFALRDIQPGEELTIDYNCAPLKDLKNTEKLTCLCGAPNCRGFVYEEAQDET